MSAIGFYLDVVRALDELGAPYMLVGAFAASTYGLRRATFDVDILVDLQEPHFDALAARFPPPRYYADPLQMRDSTRLGIMFNIIDTEQGAKADLVPLSREPKYRQAFARRVRRIFQDETGTQFAAWCARPEDIILGKLKAWHEGHSAKHPADIRELLVFALSGLGDVPIDLDDITSQAVALGASVVELWSQLRVQAIADVEARLGCSGTTGGKGRA
jgi:hypothetical protein